MDIRRESCFKYALVLLRSSIRIKFENPKHELIVYTDKVDKKDNP